MNLEDIQDKAQISQQVLSELQGDWMNQISELNRIIKTTTEWQKDMFSKFGRPTIPADKKRRREISPGELLQLTPKYSSPVSRVGPEAIVTYQPIKSPPQPIEETYEIKFNEATLIHGIAVDVHGQGATISYKAVLFVDPHYILRTVLPVNVDLPPNHPATTLYDIAIEVPKAELASESISQLGRVMDGKSSRVKAPGVKGTKTKTILRHLGMIGRVLRRAAKWLAWLTWGITAIVIYAVVQTQYGPLGWIVGLFLLFVTLIAIHYAYNRY